MAVVNYPDGARVATGETISKQWRICNESNCPLGAGYEWQFVNNVPGAQHTFGHPVLAMSQDIPPRGDYDITVEFVMPPEPGEYEGAWQLVTPAGKVLDEVIRLRVVVSVPGIPSKR